MADKKIEKALYGPSITEVILGAILGFVVGVVGACVYLVFKPVTLVREMPKEPARGMIYYLPGAESNAKSRTWQAKHKQFLAGASVQVVEDELNAWGATLKVQDVGGGTPKAGAPEPAKAPEGIFIPGKPNFRIVDGKIQVGLKCTLNWYGVMKDVTVQATGVIVRSGERFVFKPETVYLGSCPLHLLPAVPGWLVNHLTDREKIPDDVRAAWAKLSDVAIEGGALKLSVQ
ncbi:MAG: hypothetical protein JNG83_05330 [Opitutaceae bacterium]|nr:hypothetical protein [Opitutaceae bacterium]